jgi:hypothetical protein
MMIEIVREFYRDVSPAHWWDETEVKSGVDYRRGQFIVEAAIEAAH